MNNGCSTGQDLQSLRGKMPNEPQIVEGLCVEVECGVVLSCVTKTTTFTAKGKLSYTSETIYTDKDGAVITGKEIACPLKVEIVSQPAVLPDPPTPITLDGQDCSGDPLPVTGERGELVQIVQAPGQVLSVRFCTDDAADFELACGKDPATDHEIQTAYKIVNGEFVLISRIDVITGLPWTGDPSTLEACGGSGLDSDPETVCVDGVSATRWLVKENGIPTSIVHYTDADGQLFIPAAGAVVVLGSCPAAACGPTISSAFGDDLIGLLPGNSVAIQKPSCCNVRILTTAGNFLVRKGMTAYSTADFKCPVTVTGVEIVDGACTKADVIVTTQNLG